MVTNEQHPTQVKGASCHRMELNQMSNIFLEKDLLQKKDQFFPKKKIRVLPAVMCKIWSKLRGLELNQ